MNPFASNAIPRQLAWDSQCVMLVKERHCNNRVTSSNSRQVLCLLHPRVLRPARLANQQSQADREIPGRHRLAVDNPGSRPENARWRFNLYRFVRHPPVLDNDPRTKWTYILREANFDGFGVFEAADAHGG